MLLKNLPQLDAPRLNSALADCKATSLTEFLAPFQPVLAGTIPLGIDLPTSDLDICCLASSPLLPALKQQVSGYKNFSVLERNFHGVATQLYRFQIKSWKVELLFQPIAVGLQVAVRHMWVEAHLLKTLGNSFREEILRLRRAGYKTEPAFARVLQLSGDPFQAVLSLESQFEPICASLRK